MTARKPNPVLIGVAQIEQRVDDPLEGAEPLELMVRAVKDAADDAGNRDLLRSADAVYTIRGVWRYQNPARAVADRIGATGATSIGTPYGGNFVQTSVSHAARAIAAGEREIVVLTGAEHGRSQARARRAGVSLEYTEAPGDYDEMLGPDAPMQHPAEAAAGLGRPIQVYPLFETALRHARGESIEAHRERISKLWARFNAVAVENPHAWIREPLTAEQIRTPSDGNRMFGFPYTKLMNSNNGVDQAAALLLTSDLAARRAGIPEDHWVYLHASTDAHDHYFVSERDDLHSSPAIRAAGARALELAETDVDALDHVDLYSCFPSAVQVSAAELGLSEERPLTVTGGLTFGGGPLNNYVMHSIARMAEVLRGEPGSRGLVTANGGYLTKHAFGVYSTERPRDGYRYDDVQAVVDAGPRREVAPGYAGDATIEACVVMFEDGAPAQGFAACLTPDGRRTWATTTDLATLEAMTREEFIGRPGKIAAESQLRV